VEPPSSIASGSADDLPTPSAPDAPRRSPPRGVPRPVPPRGLIFLASAWLIASWIVAIGPSAPIQAHPASYAPAVRLLILLVTVGMLVGWPLVRLSGPPRAWPIRQALLDAAVLLCLMQVVVWPLRLLTPWNPWRSAAIDLAIGGWAAAVTALIAFGTIPVDRRATLVRTTAMLAIVALVMGAPVLRLWAGTALPFVADGAISAADPSWWTAVRWNPISAVYALAAATPNLPTEIEWVVAGSGWLVAAVVWAALLILRRPLERAWR
jgi:hypothetical protein